MHRIHRTVISIALPLLYFLLSSCSSPPQGFPEGNIDVDSDIYIIPMDAFLISVEPGLQTHLDNGNIPGVLQEFRDSNMELSDSISIEKKDNGWLIWDKDNRRKYYIKKDVNELNIYSYVDEKYLYPLIPKLEKRFTTKVYLALDKRTSIPRDAYDREARKYIAMYILTELMKADVPDDAKILGVVNVDLFVPQSDARFIFGQAIVGKAAKAAVISMLRMDPNSYEGGKPNEKLLAQRMMKEAVHELGHVFGLRNCGEPKCAMYLPKDLRALDKKTDSFCLRCQKAFRALRQSKASSPQDG